ncbi:MAG TPA: PAS domain S-box protein [Terriglobales bacterium]|nr:PAS domain S-box protein [Terriglobales bacterium]
MEKLASFPQMNPMPVMEIDPSGRVLYMNPASSKLFPDLPAKKLKHPYLKGISQAITEIKSSKRKWIQHEVAIKGIWYAQTIIAVDGGSRIRIYAVDITKRKKAEEALRSSEERARDQATHLQALLEVAPAVIWIAHDRECRKITGNKFGEELLRVKIGTNISKSGDEPEKLAHYRVFKDGKELTPAEMPIQQVAASGVGLRDYGLDIVFDDGTIISLLGDVTPLLDARGEPDGAIGVFTDVTERKRTRQELEDSEKKFRLAFENAQDAIVWANARTGLLIDCNSAAEKLFERSRTELIGLHQTALHPPEALEKAREIFQKHLAVQGKADEMPIVTKSGNIKTVLISASVVDLGTRKIIQGVFRDITESKKIVDALRESESKYRIVSDNTYDWEFWTNPQGKYLYVSPSCQRTTGYKQSEFLEDPELRREIIHPEDLAVMDEHIRLTEGKMKTGEVEFRIIRSDGTSRWIHHACQPVFDDKGNYLGLRGSNRDITERKKVQDALRETSNYLENLFNYANAPIICWDTKSKVTRFNHAFERLTNHRADEVIGKDLSILFPAESKEESLGKISLTASGEYWDVVEVPILRKDGKIRIVLWNSANIFAEDGKTIIATIAQGQDITERKIVEDALRETSEYLENLFNYANAPIICWDTKSKITRFNHAFEHLTEYKSEEVIGKDLSFLFPVDSKEESLGKIRQTLSGEYWDVVEVPILRKDGEIRIALWNSANIFAEDGKTIVATIAQGQDITERKKREEEIKALNEHLKQHEAELASSNKELEAFSYSVSHDLRAPLRNIDGFSHALLEDYADKLDDKGQNYLRRIRAGTQRMGELIDDLLNLSVMVRKEMRREEVNLSEQARSIVDELKHAEPERELEMKIQENLKVSGDPLLLRQLLENLIGNAWKFTSKKPSGKIEFGTTQADGRKTFFVKDNGVGFDMKYVNKMFIPFQRLHSVEEFSGNGIGLAIVKRVIDRHGGRIWAEGEVDKGATFYFTLE